MTDGLTVPDPNRFDPIIEPWWTLPMTLEWIISRTADPVRAAWEIYDYGLRDLNSSADGERLQSRLRSLHDIVLSTEDPAKPRSFVVRGRDARDELWRHLEGGELIAVGVDVGTGDRREIHGSEWLDLNSFDPNEGWPFDAIGDGFKSSLKFKSVVVPSKEVMRIWEPVADASIEAPPTPTDTQVKRRPGRKRGDGSYERLDEPLLAEMAVLIDSRKAASAEEAAKMVAEKAHGKNTLIESKVERLAKRFRAKARTH